MSDKDMIKSGDTPLVAVQGAELEITETFDVVVGDTFYARNRRYSRYRASRAGRNTLM